MKYKYFLLIFFIALVAISIAFFHFYGIVSAQQFTATPSVSQERATTTTRTPSPSITITGTSPAMEITDESDLRSEIVRLETQHIHLLSDVMRKQYDNARDFTAARRALDENSAAMAQLMHTVYEGTMTDQFQEQWNNHNQYFLDYTRALKGNNWQAQGEAKENLHRFIISSAAFFADVNDELTQEEVDTILRTKVNNILTMINAYAGQNYSESYNAELNAADSVSKSAESLSEAIVVQYPNKF